MKKPHQVDLEAAIKAAGKIKLAQGELVDVTSGEFFKARSRNHYEVNDGVPMAPPLDLNRPSIRQRIENLLQRDPGVLQRYVTEGPPDGTEGYGMDVPDDPEAPLTSSEAVYLDSVAAELAEQAPLPDEGLPRPAPETAPAAPGGGPGAVPTEPEAPSPGDSQGAASAAATRTVPTR